MQQPSATPAPPPMPKPALRARPALLLVLALAACAPSAPPAAAPAPGAATTVVVVRHAERASETDRDPPLSAPGEARARALAEALASAGVQAVYATEYRRTQQTARPLAERLGLAVVPLPGDPAAIAREVLERERGRTVLLVGHSNTVLELVRALGGTAEGELTSGDYDDIFLVLVPAEGPVRTVRTRYGAPSRGDGG